ncbi:MAG: diacylglycerol kinase family protein [Methylobacter sp.]|nr:diacylglycerol kinase family protein [Methylobacter sp.]MDP2428788.1 diacylglycerol kinase family protein [Methylobacter sp.]MDP3053991.1 diacylglycerol kinase family protein [Methylobacter sp.]MDP3361944.1 diacylglycerol kinase family protein [Methylobacter sp.]MDZ4219705.1 diacylglycerol kinase family protein [Methylobacter sp.]
MLTETKDDSKIALATLKGRDLGFWAGRWRSLNAAINGICYTLRTQPNAKIELAMAVIVMLGGGWFHISAIEWALLIFTSCVVLALESFNTAIEEMIDFVSPRYHRQAKMVKDTAAGALLVAVLGSLGVAWVIFAPYIRQLFPAA